VEDRQQGQFCRACGADLSAVRTSIGRAEAGGPAVTAREEIGRAVAAKIRELRGAKELKKVVEDVLPEVEKFLETPQERRLRRIRTGLVTAGVGLGATIFFMLVASTKDDAVPAIGVGVVAFLVGLAILINGWHFTAGAQGEARDAAERERLREMLGPPAAEPVEQPRYLSPPLSVVEHTTRNLEDGSVPVRRGRTTAE
jgi:hypothetical protein